ncbi:hypothetical protein GCM10007205_22430 [Oxalicibacterium flavum]|uniref:Uncharacterized protein n=1 Tax=Oxalicibacterium flavum TaxID=179467 RepID=A0A8J2UMN2_9BURK|nr:hypothetical protein GCM10007205_22430 [Oxalicibacterium flavum]
MHVDVGTIVWIYIKIPIGAIAGKAIVKECHSLAPSTLWNKFSNISGLNRKEFFKYFENVEKGFALSLESAERISSPVSLDILRSLNPDFQPPQFFTRLHEDNPLLTTLKLKKKLKHP